MRVGSLVYATDQGLGILAKSFYDHGIITDPVVVRHGRHPTHEDWYPGARMLGSLEVTDDLLSWLRKLDVFLAFETPFMWHLFDLCRENNVKTVLMPMHECLHQNVWRHKPDLFLCPSLLDEMVILKSEHGPLATCFIPVPVEVPWRQRTRAEVFVHNAGHGGLKGRNGTAELLEAMRSVKSGAKLILSSQDPGLIGTVPSNVEIRPPMDHADLWCNGGIGDVFVFPEKFNGLSLPLQEARAAGMLVMCGDRFPMNTWLPREPLIPVARYDHGQRIGPPYQTFDEAVFDPKQIAATIDAWYGKDITGYSQSGEAWAESMSWQTLKPMYMAVLENLCGGDRRN